MKICVSVGDLVLSKCWKNYCCFKDINPNVIDEGLIDHSKIITLTNEEIQMIGYSSHIKEAFEEIQKLITLN